MLRLRVDLGTSAFFVVSSFEREHKDKGAPIFKGLLGHLNLEPATLSPKLPKP